MNGYTFDTNFIGATGQYPIYDYITNTSNILQSYSVNSSNILQLNISNSSNILQDQIAATTNLIYKDDNSNTIVRISAQNVYYPDSGNPVEMRFQTVENNYITKITQTGELFVYHPLTPLPAGYGPGWWSVENKIANVITDTQGLRFDVTNLQAATGASAITDTATATGAVAGAGAGIVSATATTATAGSLIANGDYGSVALGLAGGALFSVLGYLSYQAQTESNLSNNGFITEGTQIHSNISDAYLLLTDNISNICIAKGFTNCNLIKNQTIPNIITSNINASNIQQGGINLNSIISIASNTLNDKIDTKQNILTESTSLLGVGSSITGINYNNITLNKPDLSLYLLRSGGVMSGQITGVSTLNATTGIFGTLSTTNNTNVSGPGIGTYGGIGDKLIFATGSTLNYPYSIGINTNSLWYSGPTGMSHNFYSGGNNLLTIDNSGNLTATGTIDSPNIKQGGTNIITLSQSNILYDTPNVGKKFAFYCSTTNLIYPDGVNPYYAYHLYVPEYVSTGYIQIGSGSGDPYRIFKIRCFYGSCYFEKLSNGIYDIIDYNIYMSNKANAGGSGTKVGINIQAIGKPENPFLNNLMKNNLFILRNGNNNFDYLTIVSKEIADVRVFIEDLLA